MKRINRLFHIVCLVALILSACQLIQPRVVQSAPAVPALVQTMPAAPDAQPNRARGDAPPYAVHGLYAVGVGNFEIEATAEDERPLTVTVWYPALNPQGAEESVTYEMGFPAGETPNVSIFGHAIENAAPAVDGAPYPLIVHTHGHWSFRQESAYLDEHLASMGFIVISADHEDNWSTLFGPKAWQSEFRRPNEVTREIDYAEKLGADGGPLAGIVDTGRVGVFGWSYGGETALVAGGARLDLGKLRAWCEENAVDGEFPDTDCVDILDHEAELAALAGLDETPQELWPDWSDERVDAVIGLAPWVGSLSEASLQTLKVPTLLMIGSSDTAAGPIYRPFQPYQKIAAERKAEVVFENAEHLLFFSACKDVPEVVDLGLEVFCTDPVWDMERGHDLINHFATAFLLAELKDDTDAATALAPENVAFTGVQYQETGYSEVPEIDPAAEPQLQGLRPDAPEFAIHGPFAVGYKPLVIGEGTDHPLDASIWYPALNPNGAKEKITYNINTKIPVEGMPVTAHVYGHALLDAEIDPSAAPYPLVIYSHGFAANAAWVSTLLEHYASYGFIVLAPEHTEQFDFDWSEIPNASIDRPNDIKQTLDYAEEMNAPDGALAGLIDMGNIAVVGHSYGGYTALAMAGAQYDMDAFNARCAALAPDDPETFLCAPIVAQEAEMAARAGLDPMPEGLWPSFGDPRVTAIVPMAGDSYLFDQAGLSKVTIPMMAIGGTADTGTPYAWGSRPAYDYASSARKTLVTFEGGEHFIMASCESMPWWSETPFYGWVCFDPVWDKDRSIDLVNHFTTAFLLAELKGDNEAATALEAENVNFPGIQYETTGYASQSGLDDATIAKIEALVEETMTAGLVPGAAVGIVKDGKLVYSNGFGVTARGSTDPVTPESVFLMASVAKSVVGMAIMQLVEDGKIELDAPVTKYLPYFTLQDPEAKEITIRQLLSHTSGMSDYGDWMADLVDKNKRTDDGVLEDYVRSFGDESLVSLPGEEWNYSNSGFDVLGDVIAKVSGQSFEAYVQDHILTPLGMADSTYLFSDVAPAKLVAPHLYNENGAKEQEFYPYIRKHGPSATLFSNVNDMAAFTIAAMNHGELDGTRVLPASAYDEMWAAQATTGRWTEHLGPQFTNYGLGWWVGDLNGHLTIGNYGLVSGFQSHLGIFPDEGFAVIVMLNIFDPEIGDLYANHIGNGMAEVLLDSK